MGGTLFGRLMGSRWTSESPRPARPSLADEHRLTVAARDRCDDERRKRIAN